MNYVSNTNSLMKDSQLCDCNYLPPRPDDSQLYVCNVYLIENATRVQEKKE